MNDHKTYGLGAAMAGGGPRSQRQGSDFYPTPPDVTAALLAVERFDGPVWEPACGDGAMARVLYDHGYEVISTDLADRGFGTGGVDFLSAEPRARTVITNPPFALAERFIRRGLALNLDAMALVLKATYWHPAKRLALWRDHPPAAVYALTWRPDFLNKGAPTMDCIWTVWRRDHAGPTAYAPLPRPGCLPAQPLDADLFARQPNHARI